jgi:uracil-DNA glycosylase family 4
MSQGLSALTRDITACRRCKRLVRCRETIARAIPKRFAGQTYWSQPVTGFGDARARLLVVGLAPGAHGANRTGRVFTGDSSGDWLYRALHRAGFANQAQATSAADGLRLTDAYVSNVVRCVPPGNRPDTRERDACMPYFVRELQLLRRVKAVIALGAFAWDGMLRAATELELAVPRPRPAFAHGAVVAIGPYTMFGCYHVSRQNTNTYKLTEAMLDAVFARARSAILATDDEA